MTNLRTRRVAVLLSGAAVVLAVSACAPDKGTVTAREQGRHCTKIGSVVNCEPDWRLEITDPTQRHPVYTDRPLSDWISVSEDVYSRCRKGAAWPGCKETAQ